MSLEALTGTLGIKRAAHLLRRATFGGSKSNIDKFADFTVDEAIAELFQDNLPDPVLPLDPITGLEWVTNGTPGNGSEEGELQEYFKAWLIGQMLGGEVEEAFAGAFQAREKITLFLHTHFTTKQSVVRNSRALYFQNQLFRIHSFDKYSDETVSFISLTKKACIDNAMLRFLDGRLNVKNNPNENFARELLELYSIGRGLEGSLPDNLPTGDYYNFTEEDVQAAARILSGFTTDDNFLVIDSDTELPRGVARGTTEASSHDFESKQFSDRFDNAIIQPDADMLADVDVTNEEVAIDEIGLLIDLIFSRYETAKHICRKLYRFYVYHEITDTIDNTIIVEMADLFISSGYKLQVVLEELLASKHFYEAEDGIDDNNFGGIIKSPLDLILNVINGLNFPIPPYDTDTDSFYELIGKLLRGMSSQGLDFYEPFEVAGYSAYHQYPIYNRSWISTNYLTSRYNYVRGMLNGIELESGAMYSVNLAQFIRDNFSSSIAGDADSLIIELCKYLLPANENLSFNDGDDSSEISAERLRYFRFAFLYSPQIDEDPEGSWTFRWNNDVDMEVIDNQLKSLFNAIMQSPEFQLM